jgi:hypothetical protein
MSVDQRRARQAALRVLSVIATLGLGAVSCGESTPGEVTGGDPGASRGGDTGQAGQAGHGGAGLNDCFGLPRCADEQVRDLETCVCRPCTVIDECADGLTCDLAEGKCREALPCADHDECGRGLACGVDGVCGPNHPGGPCARETNCPASDHCTLDFCGCTVTRYTVATVAPDVLLVLDRSESMNELVDGISKWDIARDAIGALVDAHEDAANFGLLVYPGATLDCVDGSECAAGTLLIAPAAASSSKIRAALAGASTCALGTPTAEALFGVRDADILRSTERSSHVVLITDGKSSCAAPGPAAEALLNGTPSVRTFVIGFGDAVDADELGQLAVNGGTFALSPTPGFYVAQNAAELGAALLSVAGATLPCSFDLADSPKPHGSDVLLYFGQESVVRDPLREEGWDYDVNTNRVVVYGAACEALKSKQVTEASLVYTCSFESL